ncbi:hypothetical protein Tco_0653991 [Tanacetum coccineum]|uniref:Uncharacterized protein n=1 Tax=Tanacetum coccineum TaxID=301880 RepID=A0ABQ4X1Y0_9ASTR
MIENRFVIRREMKRRNQVKDAELFQRFLVKGKEDSSTLKTPPILNISLSANCQGGESQVILWNQNRRDLPKDIPLDSVVVLRYEKSSKSENKGKVPTEMELVLEQTQQGTSYEVSVSAEGVEELKRKVKIKGENKEALLTLR